jgi:hypothetical protein
VEQRVGDYLRERAFEARVAAGDFELDALSGGARRRASRARRAQQRPAQRDHPQPYQTLLKLEEAPAHFARAHFQLVAAAAPSRTEREVERAHCVCEQRVRRRDEVVQLFERHPHALRARARRRGRPPLGLRRRDGVSLGRDAFVRAVGGLVARFVFVRLGRCCVVVWDRGAPLVTVAAVAAGRFERRAEVGGSRFESPALFRAGVDDAEADAVGADGVDEGLRGDDLARLFERVAQTPVTLVEVRKVELRQHDVGARALVERLAEPLPLVRAERARDLFRQPRQLGRLRRQPHAPGGRRAFRALRRGRQPTQARDERLGLRPRRAARRRLKALRDRAGRLLEDRHRLVVERRDARADGVEQRLELVRDAPGRVEPGGGGRPLDGVDAAEDARHQLAPRRPVAETLAQLRDVSVEPFDQLPGLGQKLSEQTFVHRVSSKFKVQSSKFKAFSTKMSASRETTRGWRINFKL